MSVKNAYYAERFEEAVHVTGYRLLVHYVTLADLVDLRCICVEN